MAAFMVSDPHRVWPVGFMTLVSLTLDYFQPSKHPHRRLFAPDSQVPATLLLFCNLPPAAPKAILRFRIAPGPGKLSSQCFPLPLNTVFHFKIHFPRGKMWP